MIYSPLARGVLAGKYFVGEPLPPDSRADRKDSRILITELRDESDKQGQFALGLINEIACFSCTFQAYRAIKK